MLFFSRRLPIGPYGCFYFSFLLFLFYHTDLRLQGQIDFDGTTHAIGNLRRNCLEYHLRYKYLTTNSPCQKVSNQVFLNRDDKFVNLLFTNLSTLVGAWTVRVSLEKC